MPKGLSLPSAGPGQAVLKWRTVWEDPAEWPFTAQSPLLCKSLWNIGYHLSPYLGCSHLWGVLRPSWLEEKYRQERENVGCLQCHLTLLLPFLTPLSGQLLHEMIRTPNTAETALLLETQGLFFCFFLVFWINTFSFFSYMLSNIKQ